MPRLTPFLLALLLASITLGWPAHEVAADHFDPGFGSISISLTTGNPPLAVRVWGDGFSYGIETVAYVEFDGTRYVAGNTVVSGEAVFDFTHVFTCAGTFEVRAWIDRGPLDSGIIDLRTWTVEVTGDPEPFTVVPQVRTGGDQQVRVEYFNVRMPERITRTTIDWGDGAGVEDITLTQLGTHLYSPFHNILAPGEFTATARNYYDNVPCPDGTDGISASVVWNLDTVVPVEPTTWGRVKALYE